jgi:hypothetical protein
MDTGTACMMWAQISTGVVVTVEAASLGPNLLLEITLVGTGIS